MSKSSSDRLVGCALAALLLAACEGNACVRESDCTSGLACRAGRCIVIDDAGSDGGTDARVTADAGADAGPRDASSDASSDAGVADASVDVGVDAM